MAAPKGTGPAGRALWNSVIKTLGHDFELTELELSILKLAAGQADHLTGLEAAVKKHGVMVRGSTGQLVTNPAIGEARQARLAIGRLLSQLEIPDVDAVPRSAASRRGKKAAETRWAERARRGTA